MKRRRFFNKYLLWVKLNLIGILGAVIISSRDLPKNPTPVRHPRSIVNGHRLEPDISSDGTDIYSDGFSQQRKLNPQPKVKAKVDLIFSALQFLPSVEQLIFFSQNSKDILADL